jgi:inner membrane protein
VPTIFGHAAVGLTLARLMPAYQRSPKAYALAAGCAMLPDIDMLTGAVGGSLSFAHQWLQHRAITHSLVFALLTGLVVTVLAYGIQWRHRFTQWWAYVLLFVAATATHGLLDACTNGGRAIALLAPFTWETYFAPWRPLEVSPFWLGIFSERGIAVMRSELLWLALPCALLWVHAAERDRRRSR